MLPVLVEWLMFKSSLLLTLLTIAILFYVGICDAYECQIQLTDSLTVHSASVLPSNGTSISENTGAFLRTGNGLVQCLHCMGWRSTSRLL